MLEGIRSLRVPFFIESIFSNLAKYGTVPLENTKRGTDYDTTIRQTSR